MTEFSIEKKKKKKKKKKKQNKTALSRAIIYNC